MNIQYFNLYTNGIGYINQIQKIDTEESTNSFFTCRISALVGNNTNIKYRSFDTIISNKDVEKLVLRCQQAVNQGKKVLISFVLSDIWYETFLHKKNGKYYKKGDPGVSLKAYLIKINMIKIDGETKYLSDQDIHTKNNITIASDKNNVNSATSKKKSTKKISKLINEDSF